MKAHISFEEDQKVFTSSEADRPYWSNLDQTSFKCGRLVLSNVSLTLYLDYAASTANINAKKHSGHYDGHLVEILYSALTWCLTRYLLWMDMPFNVHIKQICRTSFLQLRNIQFIHLFTVPVCSDTILCLINS